MANNQKVNDLIDLEAIRKQVKDTETELGKIVSMVESLNSKGVTFSKPGSLKGATDEVQEYAKQIKAVEGATAKLTVLTSDLGKAKYQEAEATKQQVKAAQDAAKATNEQASAYSRLEAQSKLLSTEAKNLGAAMLQLEKNGQKGTAEYAKLEAEFNRVAAEAKKMKQSMIDIGTAVNEGQLRVGQYEEAIVSSRTQMRQFTEELIRMELAGKGNTKEFKDMQLKAAQLADTISDTKTRIRNMGDETVVLSGLVQGVQGLVGAFSAFQGVMALVGSENEDLQRSMQKLQGLMAVMMGLQQVANMFKKENNFLTAIEVIREKFKAAAVVESTVATTANTVATEANNAVKSQGVISNTLFATSIGEVGVGMGEATVATEGLSTTAASAGASFGVVLAGAVAAVAALGALVYAMINFNDNVLKAQEDTEAWKEAQDRLNKSLDISRGKLVESVKGIETYITTLRDRGKSEKELFEQDLKIAEGRAEILAQSYDNLSQEISQEKQSLEAQKDAINARRQYSKENDGLTLSEIGQLNRIENAIAEKEAAIKEANKNAEITRTVSKQKIIDIRAEVAAEEEAAKKREKEEADRKKRENDQSTELEKKKRQYAELGKVLEEQIIAGNIEAAKATREQMVELNKTIVGYERQIANMKQYGEIIVPVIEKTKELGIASVEASKDISTIPETLKTVTTTTDALKKAQAKMWGGTDDIDEYRKKLLRMISDLKEAFNGLFGAENFGMIDSNITSAFQRATDSVTKLINKLNDPATDTGLKKISAGLSTLAATAESVLIVVEGNMNKTVSAAMDKIQSDYDVALAALDSYLENQTITQAEYDEQKAEMDKEKAAKERKLKHDEFEQDKKLAIASATIAGINATVQAFAAAKSVVLGLVMAGIAAAFAATQVSLIASAVNPYYGGRVGGKEEVATTGERGWEYISTPDGKLYKSPNTTTLTYLPEGASVMPHDLSVNYERYLNSPKSANSGSKSDADNKAILAELKYISKKPSAVINMDKYGIRAALVEGNSHYNFINNHVKIRK